MEDWFKMCRALKSARGPMALYYLWELDTACCGFIGGLRYRYELRDLQIYITDPNEKCVLLNHNYPPNRTDVWHRLCQLNYATYSNYSYSYTVSNHGLVFYRRFRHILDAYMQGDEIPVVNLDL